MFDRATRAKISAKIRQSVAWKRRWNKDVYAQRRAAGHCVICDTPTPGGKSRCKAHLATQAARMRLRVLGIEASVYEALRAAQGGCCAICGRSEQELKRALALDHNHATGQARGLLCGGCNTALGRFKDAPKLLIAAARYLLDAVDRG